MVVALLNPPNPSGWWVRWALSAGFAFAGCCGLLSAEYVYLSEMTVRKVGPFLVRRQMAWESVSVLEFGESGSIFLRSASGATLAIPADLCGIADFPDALERHLPANLRMENAEQLCTYRRFIGPVEGGNCS